MSAHNIVKEKSYVFAVSIVRLCHKVQKDKREFVLTRQLLKSGTAAGALIREAEYAESRKDFIHKMSIALKEVNETEYWLELLNETGHLHKTAVSGYLSDCIELRRILSAIVKSTKSSNSNAHS